MRTTSTILAAGLTLAFAAAAHAQTAAPQPPVTPPAEQPGASPESETGAQPTTPGIQSIDVVDMEQLPEATQSQVNEVVAERGEDSLQKLRQSIDANPEIKSALEAKGLTSAHVIAASMSPEGALTLITKKAG
jgi:hypothetical protein